MRRILTQEELESHTVCILSYILWYMCTMHSYFYYELVVLYESLVIILLIYY